MGQRTRPWAAGDTSQTTQKAGRCVGVALTLTMSLLLFGCERSAPAIVALPRSPLPVGQTLQRTLSGNPALDYLVRVPPGGGEGAPLFVSVHGNSRNAPAHARLFAPLVDSYGVVLLAPLFALPHFDDYQRLGRTRLGSRADRVLEEAVAEVARATGARTGHLYLFGYSGGAQFVHRFVMAHPERVAAAAVGSAGWYTFPDPDLPYPLGIGSTAGLPGVSFEPEAFLRVPTLVTVGERDTDRAVSLKRGDEVDRQQGRTRAERARRWVAAMQGAARSRGIPPLVEFRELPGADHSFPKNMEEAALGGIVFEYLFDHHGTVRNRTHSKDQDPMDRRAAG